MSAGKGCWPFDSWPEDDEFASRDEYIAFWLGVRDLERRGDVTALATYLREHAPLPKGIARALARIVSGEHIDSPDDMMRYALKPKKIAKQGSRPIDPTIYRRQILAARLIHDRVVNDGSKFEHAFKEAQNKYQLGTKTLQDAVSSFEVIHEAEIPRSKRGRPRKPRAESEP